MMAIVVDGGRRLLISLLLAAAIPMLVFGGWVAYGTAQREQDRARSAVFTTTRLVAEKLAAELGTERVIAETLAGSSALDSADLAAFYTEAQRVTESRSLWTTIALSGPDGVQLLNLLRPLGERLGHVADQESFAKALRTRAPLIGGLGPVSPLSGQRLIAIQVPVMRGEELRYMLTVGLSPERVSEILLEAGAPSDWFGVVVDAKGAIVARTRRGDEEAGRPASHAVRDAISRWGEGFYMGHTLEGVEVETVFRTLPEPTGWSVHFGIPTGALEAPMARALTFLVTGGVASLGLAGSLAALIARDLAQRRRTEEDRAALALQLSEERGAVAVEAADLGTWRWDKTTKRVFGSDRMRSLLDLPPLPRADREGEWPAEAILAAIHPKDRASLEEAVSRCLATGEVLDLEFRAVPREGSPRWVRAIGRAVRSDATTMHGVLVDVEPRKRAEAERRDLLRRLSEAQENEQRRIARELHDQVGQTVTGLSLGLKGLERRLDGEEVDPETHAHLRWLQGLAREVGRDIHRASSDLRPTALDDLGLQRALAAHAADWSRAYGIDAEVQSLGSDERLPPEVETAVYRAVQEALTNVLKHAGARHVSIVVERWTRELRVVVEDDGRGFDPQAVGRRDGSAGPPLGLSGIRERLALVDGQLRIESSPEAGTALFIHVPLALQEASRAQDRADTGGRGHR